MLILKCTHILCLFVQTIQDFHINFDIKHEIYAHIALNFYGLKKSQNYNRLYLYMTSNYLIFRVHNDYRIVIQAFLGKLAPRRLGEFDAVSPRCVKIQIKDQGGA